LSLREGVAVGKREAALFLTDDQGCYCTRTRDVQPGMIAELDDGEVAVEQILAVCRENTIRVKEGRLDLPSTPPYVLPPNLWWANSAGSTLYMPVGDASEEALGLLALMIRHGVMLVDHDMGEPAGNLGPFVQAHHIDTDFYDAHYRPGAYLETHEKHLDHWHNDR